MGDRLLSIETLWHRGLEKISACGGEIPLKYRYRFAKYTIRFKRNRKYFS